ncbi:MAG: YfhO family protein, partial [Clostridiales bacterium]|nr:YfhO family protein [Clostridiales bacterium]
NMPLVFVSLLVTVLCTVYFVSKAFAPREKKFYAVAFILIYASLSINFIDVAWQVFDSPNWFWHREAFVFITLFLTVAYKAFENIKKIPNSEILKAAGVLAVLLLLAQSFGEMKGHGDLFIFNAVIIAVITLILIGLKKEDWSGQVKDMGKILPVLLAVFTIYESAFLAPMVSSGTSTLSVFNTEGESFVNAMLSIEDCANASNIMGNGFRSEYDNLKTVDDIEVGGASQYAGYRGITIFNSNSNKAIDRFMKQLGYSVNYNYFAAGHSYSAPATDAFFSIGSLYMTNPDYTGAELIASDDNLSFYANRTVLPIVFTANASARDFDFYSLESEVNDKNYFAFQNDWYASLFASFGDDFFVPVSDGAVEEQLLNGSVINIGDYRADDQFAEEDVSVSTDDESDEAFDPDELGLEVTSDYYDTQLDVYRLNKSLPIILNYEVTVDRADELYVNISVPRTNSGCEVYLNGYLIDTYSAGTFYSTILRLGFFEPGETVQLSILADHDKFTYLSVNFAYFDAASFEAQFEGVPTDNTVISEAEDGYISFSADVEVGQMILTSIPYEEGWTATVDGQEVEIKPYQNALISLDAAPGHHDVTLQYTPPGLKGGAILTIVGIIGLIGVSVVERKNKR